MQDSTKAQLIEDERSQLQLDQLVLTQLGGLASLTHRR